MNKEQPGRWI